MPLGEASPPIKRRKADSGLPFTLLPDFSWPPQGLDPFVPQEGVPLEIYRRDRLHRALGVGDGSTLPLPPPFFPSFFSAPSPASGPPASPSLAASGGAFRGDYKVITWNAQALMTDAENGRRREKKSGY